MTPREKCRGCGVLDGRVHQPSCAFFEPEYREPLDDFDAYPSEAEHAALDDEATS